MPTLRQSPGQVRDKVADMSWTQIMKVRDTNHVADFHDLCPRLCRKLVPDFVTNISTCRDGWCLRLSWFVSMTFPVGKFRWKST